MKQLFENSKSFWVRYSDYVITDAQDGTKYMLKTGKPGWQMEPLPAALLR